MQNLQELNNYSATQITFEDGRNLETRFDRTTPNDQTFAIFENQAATLVPGIEIVEIINPGDSDVEYLLDFTGVGVDVTLNFGTLPSGVTVTESPSNYFTVSGIDNANIWEQIKSPQASFAFGTVGTATFSTAIEYTLADSSRGTKTTNYTGTITEVDYLDSVAVQFYSAYEQAFVPDTPIIVADQGIFDPVYTMEISVSTSAPIELMSVTGNDSAVFNTTTGTLTFSGRKDDINDTLDTIEIDFTGVNEDFFATFTLTNNLNSNVDIEIAQFGSNEFVANPTTVADMTGVLTIVQSASAEPTAIFDLDSQIGIEINAGATGTSIANMTSGADITVPIWSGTFSNVNYAYGGVTGLTLGASPNLQDQTWAPTWTVTGTPNYTQPIDIVTSSGSGGTFSFNNTTKVITITGTTAQVNSHLDNLNVDFTLYYDDVEITWLAVDSVYSQNWPGGTQTLVANDTSLLLGQSGVDSYTDDSVASTINNGPSFSTTLAATVDLEITAPDANIELNSDNTWNWAIAPATAAGAWNIDLIGMNFVATKDFSRAFIDFGENNSYSSDANTSDDIVVSINSADRTVTYEDATPLPRHGCISKTGDYYGRRNKVYKEGSAYDYSVSFTIADQTVDRSSDYGSAYSPTVTPLAEAMSLDGNYVLFTANHSIAHPTLSGQVLDFREWWFVENNKDDTYTILDSGYVVGTPSTSFAGSSIINVEISEDGTVYVLTSVTRDDTSTTAYTFARNVHRYNSSNNDWNDTTSISDFGSVCTLSEDGDRLLVSGRTRETPFGAPTSETNVDSLKIYDWNGSAYVLNSTVEFEDMDTTGETTVWNTSSVGLYNGNITSERNNVMIGNYGLNTAGTKIIGMFRTRNDNDDYYFMFSLEENSSGNFDANDAVVKYWEANQSDEEIGWYGSTIPQNVAQNYTNADASLVYTNGVWPGTTATSGFTEGGPMFMFEAPEYDTANNSLSFVAAARSINATLDSLKLTTGVSSGTIVLEYRVTYNGKTMIRKHTIGET